MSEGEEARLVPGDPSAAEIWSRDLLPLRVRTETAHHARPAFPGTAVVLGEETYEVIAETPVPERARVRYQLRAWPLGEVERGRVVYGASFVRGAEQERARARVRARARPWRIVLYPFVGLLPEEDQDRVCEALGLYAVTATIVSGLAESLLVFLAIALFARGADTGRSIAMLLAAPGLVFLVLPGLGRAASALLLRETAGSFVLVALLGLFRRAGVLRPPPPRGFVPLTRAAFWERLARPDDVRPAAEGARLVRGRLPHLTWDRLRRLQAADDYWLVEPCPPEIEGPSLVYSYRLVPLGDPPGPGEPAPSAPPPTAYPDEVLGEVRCEWDAFNAGLAWLTTLLSADAQARAFDHRGGPQAARRSTLATSAAAAITAVYLLSFLPGPAGDPLAPAVAVFSVLLLLDAGRRVLAARAGRYAPSLFRVLLPAHLLRPERVAYRAHRDGERRALDLLSAR